MSEELNKAMEDLEEADASTAKVNKIKIGDTEQEDPDFDGAVSKAKENKAKAKAESKKIKAESKKVKEEDDEEEDSDEDEEESDEQVKKESVSIPKLKSEMLDGLVAHMKGLKKEDLAKMYGSALVEDDDEEDEDEDEKAEREIEDESAKKVKESIDQKVEALDISKDVEALVVGEELSDEFKTKAATIFETAVKTKVREELTKIQEENDGVMQSLAEDTMSSVVEKIDDYLNYVVEQWMEDNQLAIERGLKGEIAEDFISGLKGLFEDHYIDVPDEKYDILEANLSKIEELEDKLNKQMEENVQLNKAKGELVKESMIADIADGMTDTETEKFQSLVEDVEFSDGDSYNDKLKTIKESYFGTGAVEPKEVITEEGTNDQVEVSDSMAKYMTAIKKDNHRSGQKQI